MAGTLKLTFRKPMPFRRYYDQHIAKGGLFIPTQETLPVMARVRVSLDLAFCGEKLELDGEVVQRVEGAEAGLAVQLLDPVAKLRERFEALLPAPEPTPPPPAPSPAAPQAPAQAAAPVAPSAPAAANPAPAAATPDAADLDISDDELDTLLAAEEGGGEPELPLDVLAPAGFEDPDDIPPEALMDEASAAPLPPGDDPEAIDPTSVALSPDDPEPTPGEPMSLEGPYDPAERTIAE